MKIYMASPFFSKFDCLIRDRSIEKIKKYGLDSVEVFRPDDTETSKSYSVSPGTELGQKIFEENISHIESCDALLFWNPDNDDLGTMMEVGVALKLGKRIFRFDYLRDKIIEVIPEDFNYCEFTEETFIKIESVSDAVLMGYNYQCPHKIYYEVPEGKDNIMLQFLGTKIEKSGKCYKESVVDFKEVS